MIADGVLVRGQPPAGMPALVALTRRELVRFVRQPSRVVAALGTPLLIWALFGSGFAGSFAGGGGGGGSYAGYLLPGMASLTVLFSSIFAAMSLIEDRHAGFLQSVLVSPAPRWAVIGSKVAGGTILSAAQGVVLLVLLAPLMGLGVGVAGFATAVLALVLISVLINGIGLAAAWRIDSTQGFHGVMNLVLMPMWVLSGAMFPAAGAARWLKVVMYANPLYWPTAALRGSLGAGAAEATAPGVVWLIAAAVAAAGFGLAWGTVGRLRRAGSLAEERA